MTKVIRILDDGPYDDDGRLIIRGRDVKFVLDRLKYLDTKMPLVKDTSRMEEERTVWNRFSKAIDQLKKENKELREQIALLQKQNGGK